MGITKKDKMQEQWMPFSGEIKPYFPIKNADLRARVHNYYRAQVVELGFKFNGEQRNLYTPNGILIATAYKRVVIGDFGAYVEIDTQDILKNNLIVKAGQEYRIGDPRYKDTVKYNWLTVIGDEDIKVYFQKKTVLYADYKVGMIYIDPREITLGEINGK